MVSYIRPGVYVEESLRTRNPDSSTANAAAVFIASHGRGPEELHLVRSWSDFTRIYGGFPSRTSLLPYSVFQYFNNGGRDAYILRVVGTGGSPSDTSFDDRHSSDPLETLQVEAVSIGEWGNEIYIGISDADERFDLTVYYGGTDRQNIVERFPDLTMDPNSGRYVETAVNSILSGSKYITVHDTESANQATDGYDGVRPAATTTPVQLSGGDNGAAVGNTELTDALEKLESLSRTYVLNYPGVHDVDVINPAISHVEGHGNGFVIVDPPPDLTPQEVVDHAATLQSSSHAAIYYPYVQTSDPGAGVQGATRLTPPGGAVAGQFSATDSSRGVWKAPAGLGTNLAGVVSTERRLTSEDLELLNENHVNAIRHAPGAGFVIWGARTRKKTQADKYVPVRRTLIHLKRTLEDQTEWAVFEPNDEVLWETLQSTIEAYLNGFWQQGGLRGAAPNEAFYVKSDGDLNPLSAIEAGVVNVEIGVALQYPAEFVIIKLSQWEGGASTTDSATA